MDSADRWIVPLAEAADCDETVVGGKAAKISQLMRGGFPVPNGFCLTAIAYERFVAEAGLEKVVDMEMGRKPLDEMRWEEIWDAALRIRSAFLRAEIPAALAEAIGRALLDYAGGGAVAVRSSAPGEDSQNMSFAGLHESIIGVEGTEAIRDAVRIVWASLWSDAALLYRRELSLDSRRSRMAVLIQEVMVADCSGVAFGRDPRDPQADSAIIEAVPGPCALLVDGSVDPDRWILDRSSGAVLQWRAGNRETDTARPLLEEPDLAKLLDALRRVEGLFGWPPDVEWIGRSDALVLLQARPITTTESDSDDEREWYLSLRPDLRRLRELADRVTDDLIPRLQATGARFAAEQLDRHNDRALAGAIQDRLNSLQGWRKTYWDEFIPFAHGVRQLARYYNDAVRPSDPYEFVGLLRSHDILASQRNQSISRLAEGLRHNLPLKDAIAEAVDAISDPSAVALTERLKPIHRVPGGAEFLEALDAILADFMDITYGSERLLDRPDLLLHTVLELAADSDHGRRLEGEPGRPQAETLERRFLQAVGLARREEAAEVLRIGRISWRLRDDDNLLLSRVESQLFRAVDLALARLRGAGRLPGEPHICEEMIPKVIRALTDPSGSLLEVPAAEEAGSKASRASQETPRQLVGQPASPGLATGKVRVVATLDDIGQFRAGEVLVCDAIQPMMTHVVPLAAGIVERRGGMLIHGAIIAREMKIPCVNGIAQAAEILEGGEIVTVDGYLGIVTVGPPEFDMELG